jgi:hypothetical protein
VVRIGRAGRDDSGQPALPVRSQAELMELLFAFTADHVVCQGKIEPVRKMADLRPAKNKQHLRRKGFENAHQLFAFLPVPDVDAEANDFGAMRQDFFSMSSS